MARILVTGATGLIGSYAVPQLINAGHEVFGVSRSGKGPCGISLDLFDSEAVSSFIEAHRPEYLLHLAWNVAPGYMTAPDNLDWVVSSLHLLKTFAECGGKRAAFTGSCIEYDWSYGFMQEDITPLKSDSLYGTAKASLYSLASSWAKHTGFSFAWGRVFFLYGRCERPERITRYVVDCLKRGEKPAMKFPYISRDYMHAADVAGGLIALMFSEYCGAVNIASGQATRLCDIAKKAAEVLGCPVPEYEYAANNDTAPLVLGDSRRLNDVIGFRPSITWHEGLKELL
ncbi:MAG: NAD(P)-dependent oxidoreductase [Synergistaceae bacterium]|nr:NAD(P)-dependent oxidoreductase [Synergistaceae bacterium]